MASGSNSSSGPTKDKDDSGKDGKIAKTGEATKKSKMKDLIDGMVQTSISSESSKSALPDMSKHKFWGTQPVPRFSDETPDTEGPIHPQDLTKVPTDPYPLIPGFEWVTMDLNDSTQLQDVYTLLYQNYVEDQDAMFRFNYSASFLNWALKSPGWRAEWHIGIRASASRKLVAFISGVPVALRVRSASIHCSEINFLCVHKKLREKRLAPVLIREITRRCNLVGIWQAIYTGGILLPTPVSTCRYYHRSIDWVKLNEVGFSPLPHGSSKAKQVARYKLPDVTATKGLREMQDGDVDAVLDLLRRYLDTMTLAQEFKRDEVKHWLLDASESADARVVYSYVVEEQGHITDFFSFYCIESTVIGNDKHNSIKVAYLFYYATEAAFGADNNGAEKAMLKKRLNELMNDALILAKKAKFDVFNALTLLDNPLFLTDQKFGPGDGRLHYYLYNYRTAKIPGGIYDVTHLPDTSAMGGVGVVML